MAPQPLRVVNKPATKPRKVKYYRKISQIEQLTPEERQAYAAVEDLYAFRANDYYLNLIDWNDPKDPIRQLIIPRPDELEEWGRLDASNEKAVTVAHGVQHKYQHTVLLLCNEVCGAYCRYCFRKRLFMNENDEASNDISEGIRYIAQNEQVTNVLLTGGDPLLMSTRRLRSIIEQLHAIPHVRIVRIGSKMMAFDPFRISQDQELLTTLSEFSTGRRRVYMMAHFDHPRELTDEAVECMDALIRAGVICCNQCPLIRGVNDDPEVLAELWRELSFIGAPPYYLFQCRPTAGNGPYAVPLVEGWEIFREAMRRGSGLARRARYCMSHELGKIEITGVTRKHIHLRFHRAKDLSFRGVPLKYKRNDEAFWVDDLEPVRGTGAKKYPPSPMLHLTDGPD